VLTKIDDAIGMLPINVHSAAMHVRVVPAVLVKLGAVFNTDKCNFSLSQKVLWHGHVF